MAFSLNFLKTVQRLSNGLMRNAVKPGKNGINYYQQVMPIGRRIFPEAQQVTALYNKYMH